MPGRLGRNLRKGHLAENLGILILRGFCAVTQIRQEDDIGIDAVATLMQEEGNRLVAVGSFAVQIKAASVSEIKYSGDEIRWFLDQRVPLFVAVVDINASSFAIYPTSPARRVMQFPDVENLILTFDTLETTESQRCRQEGKDLRVKLGPPIFTCNENESRSDSFAARVFKTMSSWIDFENRNIEIGRINKGMVAKWETDGSPKPFCFYGTGNAESLPDDMEAALPYIEKLSQHLFWAEPGATFKEAVAFQLFADWF